MKILDKGCFKAYYKHKRYIAIDGKNASFFIRFERAYWEWHIRRIPPNNRMLIALGPFEYLGHHQQ